MVEVFRGDDVALLLSDPHSPSGRVDRTYPWPALFFPIIDGDPFCHIVPADFGERAAREGRISAADAWSVWTEETCSAHCDRPAPVEVAA